MKNLKLILIGWLVLCSTAQAQIYVDLSASGNNDGSSWADAFTDIQSAVDAALENDEIHIAQGTYKEGAEVTINHPITIKGGYPTGGGTQDIASNATIIDGNNSHRVLNATHNLGTLYLEGLTLQNGLLSGSSIAEGAGINSTGNLNLIFVNVSNNTASSSSNFSFSSGGGIYTSSGNITLTNSSVNNNTATSSFSFSFSDGGGIYTGSGSITLTNTLVSNNTASSTSGEAHGGGIYTSSGNITLTNSQVSNNIASGTAVSSGGGGIFTGNGINNQNTILFQNSILWGNNSSTDGGGTFSASEFDFLNPVDLTINHSLVKEQNPTGTDNIDATVMGFDPLFIDEAGGNFGLQKTSGLVNAGDDSVNSSTLDLLGNSRKIGTIDIGPYEAPDFNQNIYNTAAQTYYFNPNTTASNQDGLSWATAFNSLNDYFHIEDKSNISQIYLAKGVYITSGTLEFTTALTISGGYDAQTNTQTTALSRIDVHKNGRVISTTQDINITNCLIVNGFIHTFSFFDSSSGFGGGIYTSSGNITLSNSLVSNNTVDSNNSSMNSLTESFGGGIYTGSGNITLTNSQISNNTASSDDSANGGGIYTGSGNITLTNSQISNNTASSDDPAKGGGIYTGSGNITLTNSQVSNNIASGTAVSSGGGGIFTGNGINNQVVLVFQNSILWGNEISTDGGSTFSENEYVFQNPVNNLTINHSLIKNQNPTGTNNIDATQVGFDPLFINEAGGNFRLQYGSPLIDAGDFNLLPLDDFDVDGDGDLLERIPLDLDGYAREIGLDVDMGPYEYGDLIFRDGFE